MNPDGYIDPRACIGMAPEHRAYRFRLLEHSEHYHAPLIHESAIVEAFASVDCGLERPTMVGELAYVMKHAHVGHDAILGAECNLAPHAVLGGHVVVGPRTRIGIGAVVRPRVTIGDRCVIGAGAVVVDDVPSGEVWVGNPARPIKRRNHEYGLQVPDQWAGSEEEFELWLEAFGPGYQP